MMLQSKLSRQTKMYKQEVLLNKFSHILGSAILGSAILGSANLPFLHPEWNSDVKKWLFHVFLRQ